MTIHLPKLLLLALAAALAAGATALASQQRGDIKRYLKLKSM